jgi:hypothetical protein
MDNIMVIVTSEDGGRTVHKDNEDMSVKMEEIAEKLVIINAA